VGNYGEMYTQSRIRRLLSIQGIQCDHTGIVVIEGGAAQLMALLVKDSQRDPTGAVAPSSLRSLTIVLGSVTGRAHVPTSGRTHAATVSASKSCVLVLEQLLI
jgi:hypothetical protein